MKHNIQQLIALYQSLGLLDATGSTATELIQTVEANIRHLETTLLPVQTDDRAELLEKLRSLSLEQGKLNAELQDVSAQLAALENRY